MFNGFYILQAWEQRAQTEQYCPHALTLNLYTMIAKAYLVIARITAVILMTVIYLFVVTQLINLLTLKT